MKRIRLKRICALTLSAALLFCALGVLSTGAATDGVLEYTVNNGCATVTRCNAATASYTLPDSVGGYPLTGLAAGFIAQNSAVQSLTVPASVKAVPAQCFRGHCPEEIVFAGTENINFANQAFYLANGLKRVVLPEQQQALSTQMFRSSTVAEVVMPDTLKTISDEAFYDCKSLAAITLPEQLESIGVRAFYAAINLSNHIVIPQTVQYIGSQAFYYCIALSEMTVLSVSCEIADSAFDRCTLKMYGCKNATLIAHCAARDNLQFVCRTDEDHDYPDEYTLAVEPTAYRYGLAICACKNCGKTFSRVLDKLTPQDPAPQDPTPPVDPPPAKPWDSYVSGEDWENRFDDVAEDAWYRSAVGFAAANELFGGTEETLFSPDMAMSRAMLVTVLWRMAGSPAAQGENRFADVAAESYYAPAVLWARENGIVSGVTEKLFAPDRPVDREQAATLLFRYGTVCCMNVDARETLDGFSDSASVSPYAQRPLQWAVGAGVMEGIDGALSPKTALSRAQAAMLLMRLWTQVIRAPEGV